MTIQTQIETRVFNNILRTVWNDIERSVSNHVTISDKIFIWDSVSYATANLINSKIKNYEYI